MAELLTYLEAEAQFGVPRHAVKSIAAKMKMKPAGSRPSSRRVTMDLWSREQLAKIQAAYVFVKREGRETANTR